MKTAWLFPGQDAFEPRTGLAWAEHSEAVWERLCWAQEACGVPLLDPRMRRRVARFDTTVVQPLLTALCLGIVSDLVAAGAAPDVVAGASLGELSAWAVATGVPHREAIHLAHRRGVAMVEAARATPGTMRAIRASESEVGALLGRQGVSLGARNGAQEWVLTGPSEALSGIPGRPVPVLGPWHAPAMAPAARAVRDAIPSPRSLMVPMALNDGGRWARDASDLGAHLVRQLVRPAEWFETVRTLVDAGVERVVTVGPGRVLRSQLRHIAPELLLCDTDRPRKIEEVLACGA